MVQYFYHNGRSKNTLTGLDSIVLVLVLQMICEYCRTSTQCAQYLILEQTVHQCSSAGLPVNIGAQECTT